MKKLIFLIAILPMILFSGCSDDEFAYPQDVLCGTWDGTHVKVDDYGWVDITSSAFSKYQFSIKFNSDGTYYGKGYFGTGSGTYSTSGKNVIITYVGGKEYLRYRINSLNGTTAELTMISGSSTLDIKAKKR